MPEALKQDEELGQCCWTARRCAFFEGIVCKTASVELADRDEDINLTAKYYHQLRPEQGFFSHATVEERDSGF